MNVTADDAKALFKDLGFDAAVVEAWTWTKLEERINLLPGSLKGRKAKSGRLKKLLAEIVSARDEGERVEVINVAKKKGPAPKGGKGKPVDDDEVFDLDDEEEDDEAEEVEFEDEVEEEDVEEEEEDDGGGEEDEDEAEDDEDDQEDDEEEEVAPPAKRGPKPKPGKKPAAVVADDEEDDEEDENDDYPDDDAEDEFEDDEEDDTPDEEDEEVATVTKKPAGKGGKTPAKAPPPKTGKAGKVQAKPTNGKIQKAGGEGKPGVIASIIEFLGAASEQKPITKKEILAKLKKRFPDRGDEMMTTINIHVPTRLRDQKQIDVRKNEDGYYLGGRSKKPAK